MRTEIKDMVREKIADIINRAANAPVHKAYEHTNQILSIPELAIVDLERDHHPIFWKNCVA